MKYLALFSIIFWWFSPISAHAKVPQPPSPWEHWEETKKLNNIYDQTVEILLSSGYDRSVNGLKVGFIKQDFELTKNRSLYVMPVINRTGDDSESMQFFTTRIRDKTAQALKETGLFSSVISSEKTGDKSPSADLKLQIYLRAMANKNCLWGIEVYDGKTGEKILAGFDKVSTSARDFAYGIFINSLEDPSPAAFFLENIPKRATLFVGRANSDFDKEYFSKLQRRPSPRGY